MGGTKSLASRQTLLEATLAGAALVFCALLLLIFGFPGRVSSPWLAATEGSVALPEEALDGGAIFGLPGPWEMYWGRLLTPDDLARPDAPLPSGTLLFPGSWRGMTVDGRRLPGTGVATFRLKLLPPPGDRALTLRLFDLRLAYRLWANGQPIAESGVPGLDLASERPARTLVLANVSTHGEPIDLVLQLSNQRFRAGGVGHQILVAETGVLETDIDRQRILSALFCGVLLVTGIYHLMLYALRRREISLLYFGIYALVLFGYAANSNSTGWLSHPFLPSWITLESVDTFSLLCYASSGAILYRFYRSLYPEDFSRGLRLVSDLRFPAFLLSEAFLPPVWTSWIVVVLMVMGLALSSYYLVRLTACTLKRRPGAILLLCGAVLLAYTSVHDMLVHASVIEDGYTLLHGLFALIIFQSMALALRYAQSFTTIETLSSDLGRHVTALETEMAKRHELESEIVRISEEERRRISYQLHDGLCQQLTAARISFSMLSGLECVKDEPALGALGNLLSSAAEDAYALSRGLWPVEYDDKEAGLRLGEWIEQAERSSGIRIVLDERWPCADCDGIRRGVVHRIIQEAIANAIKHAEATRIDVALRCREDGTIELEVTDNGVGLAAANRETRTGGLGLRIMAHRAHAIGAELDVSEAVGGGTVVRCRCRCAKSVRQVDHS